MAVQHAAHKKKVLSEIMRLMEKAGGSKMMPKHEDGETTEPEETDDAPDDQRPKAPAFTWADGKHDDQDSGDEEDAPSDDELDAMAAKHAAMGAKLAKHGRR